MQPSRAALAFLAALVIAGGLFVCVLYALTTPADRPDLLGRLVPALAGVLAGFPALLAWLAGQKLNAQHAETSAAVARVEEQTNGALTARIKAANDLLREELLAELLPPQRSRPVELHDAEAAALAAAEHSHAISAHDTGRH